MCPRQNGKNSILEARELAGLYLLGERLLIHSAHLFDTSLEAFRRLENLVEGRDEFSRRVKRISRSHGEEGLELYGPKGRRVSGGQRIRFRTRTKGGGRGFVGDCVLFDEAMILPETSLGAIMPIVSARPNPQVWYTGSAVDRLIHEHGAVLGRIRARGVTGNDPALAYFEWSHDAEHPDDVDEEIATSPQVWAAANPALGIRISEEHIAKEQRSMEPRTFSVERLGVGDWPRTDGQVYVIDPDLWDGLADIHSTIEGAVAFGFDVSPDRSRAAISVSGLRSDSLSHIEVIEHRPGTGWLPARLLELARRHRPVAIVCDAAGPAGSLLPELEKLGIEVTSVSAKEHAHACGMIYDACEQRTLRHLGSRELSSATRGAAKRPLGDAWAWHRKGSDTDISPLVACTLALWGLVGNQTAEPWAGSW